MRKNKGVSSSAGACVCKWNITKTVTQMFDVEFGM